MLLSLWFIWCNDEGVRPVSRVAGLTPGRALLLNNRRQTFQFFGKLFSETEKREATSDRPYNAGVLLWDFGSFLKTVKIALWFDAISRHLRSTLKSPLFICYRALQFGTGVKTGKVTPRYERSADYRPGDRSQGLWVAIFWKYMGSSHPVFRPLTVL